MTMYRMGMLGDFDRSVFASEFESSLFGGYTFFVVIVMTNVLIAIVSDSYGARCVFRVSRYASRCLNFGARARR